MRSTKEVIHGNAAYTHLGLAWLLFDAGHHGAAIGLAFLAAWNFINAIKEAV